MKTGALKTAINDALETISFANFGSVVVTPEWIYDNDPTSIPTGKAPWIRVSVRLATTMQKSFGGGAASKRIRKTGIVFLQIFTKIDQGSGLSDHISTEIEGPMTSVTIAGVTYRAVMPGFSGRSEEEDGYWQQNLNLPFYSDRFQ